MNRSSSSSLVLTKALIGFLNYKTAEGLTPSSVDSYRVILQHWVEFTGDIQLKHLSSDKVGEYLLYLRNEYIPQRFGGDTRRLAPKTLRNHWICLSSFFRWANKEFQVNNLMRDIPAPRFQRIQVEPFTQDEVLRMLKACLYCHKAETADRGHFVMRCHTADRDQALIVTLVDTGLRASELCSLRIGEFDAKHGKLDIKQGLKGGAKGGKGRIVYLGKSCKAAPGRSTHKMSFSTSRMSTRGRPLPSARCTFSGINGSKITHYSSVVSIGLAPLRSLTYPNYF